MGKNHAKGRAWSLREIRGHFSRSTFIVIFLTVLPRKQLELLELFAPLELFAAPVARARPTGALPSHPGAPARPPAGAYKVDRPTAGRGGPGAGRGVVDVGGKFVTRAVSCGMMTSGGDTTWTWERSWCSA